MSLNEWKHTTLGELSVKISKGTTPSTVGFDFNEKGRVHFIKAQNLLNSRRVKKDSLITISIAAHEKLKRSQLKTDDILVSIAGSIGRLGIVNQDLQPSNCNQAVAFVRLEKTVNKHFIYYFLLSNSAQNHFKMSVVESVQANLSLGLLSQTPVLLPPIQEQKAIAEVLSSLDDKIELLQKQNETLEALAQTLFRQWFIEEADDSWEEVTYDSLFKIIDCLHSKKPDQLEKGKPLLQVYNIGEIGLLDLSKPYFVSNSDYETWTKRIELTSGDALISKTGRVGAIGFIPSGHTFGIGRNLVGLKIKKDIFFCRALLLSKHTQREIRKNTSDGTILSSLHVKSISKMKIKYDSNRAKLVDAQLEPIYQKVENNWACINTLTETRNTLLPKLMSGQVRVKLD